MASIRPVHVLVVISSNEKKSSCAYYIFDIALQLTVFDKYTHVPYNVLGGSQLIPSLTFFNKGLPGMKLEEDEPLHI
uniref:Uncharacterized protein n=1 Tax=Arundo donax TaxID=35708 RepID=A0A0A9AFW1_ARUDO